MAQPLAAPYSYFADANGAPLSGGKVYTYFAGTSTPQAAYTDSTGGIALSNPVILDSAGRAQIWLIGSYKIIVKDSLDNTISTTDNITASSATATELNYLSGVTPGVAIASKALVVDSSSNITGIATNTFNFSSTGIANMAAIQGSQIGGFINKFRNGTFDIWQRGTSGTITAGSPSYTADGWIVGCTGANIAWARQPFGSTLLPYNYYILLTGATSCTDAFIKQRIESVIAQQLKSSNGAATVQIRIQNNTGASLTPTLTIKHPTASDNWAATVTDVNAVSLQTITNGATATVCYTWNVQSGTENGLEITFDFGTSLNSAAKNLPIYIADVRSTPGVSIGLNSLPPAPELRPYPMELIYCQRYLPSYGDVAGVIGNGYSSSTTASGYFIGFDVPTRIAPTGLTVNTVGDYEIATYAGADVAALTAMTFNSTYSSNIGAHITTTVASGLTASTPYMLDVKTARAGSLIFTGAEL